MEQVSRRSFIKGAAVVGLAGGLAGLAGCSQAQGSPSGGSAAFMPGKYAAEVMGHNAPFTVEVTFNEYAIVDIDTSSSLESPGVGLYAMDRIAEQIISTQSFDVDTVAGATLSSMALIQGVQDCIGQAGGGELSAVVDSGEAAETEYTADVCVVGGGGGGCVAAIRAAQAGAKVVVMEKCGILGGSTNVSGGALNAVDPYRQEKQGIEDSVEKFYQSTLEGGHNIGDPVLVDFLTAHAMESVEWLEEIGCAFKMKVGSATGSLGERSHYTVKPAGSGYTDAFRDWIANNPDKITVVAGTQATELITGSDGSVTGVRGRREDGEEIAVTAKSVVLATGGFGSNVEYRQQVNTGVWAEVPLDETIGCTNIKPCAQGDGLKLAESVGAELIGLSDIQLHPCGTPGTGLMQHIRTSGRNRVFVNEEGARFVSEGAARDTLCKAIFDQTNSTYWIVVNKVRYPSLTEPDKDGERLKDMIALGSVIAADTLEELASATGMDEAKLKDSIDTYNAVVAGEMEDPFGFEANNSADVQLTEGPWYACKKVPTVHHTMGGIRIDVDSQVLDASGSPIANLYAVGECTGGIHGSNRLGGNAIADIMTFGRNAGLHAAENAGAAVE